MVMALGSLIISSIALSDLHTLLSAVSWLWLAVKIFRGAKQPLVHDSESASGQLFLRAFLIALGTQLSNPKTAVVFAGIFAALLPVYIPPFMYVILPLTSMLVDGLWYAFVACVLSASRSRWPCLRHKTFFDRLGGGVMALLGIKLIAK